MYNTRLQTWKLTNLSLSSDYTNKLRLSIKKKAGFYSQLAQLREQKLRNSEKGEYWYIVEDSGFFHHQHLCKNKKKGGYEEGTRSISIYTYPRGGWQIGEGKDDENRWLTSFHLIGIVIAQPTSITCLSISGLVDFKFKLIALRIRYVHTWLMMMFV